MVTVLRHLLSILLLPFMVVVGAPFWILTSFEASDSQWSNGTPIAIAAIAIGALFVVGGFGMFSWCLRLFMRVGQGTLAPWDPTRKLVAVGPYRHVRNPMISGVVCILIGEALVSGSWLIGAWAVIFLAMNHLYFLAIEEPGLEARFGEAYCLYKTHVPRWIPRRTPWSGH